LAEVDNANYKIMIDEDGFYGEMDRGAYRIAHVDF
tara:strand:- start:2989 stop:3093 length:105 start_codon:yes stop_codon:yes gene_type:complete